MMRTVDVRGLVTGGARSEAEVEADDAVGLNRYSDSVASGARTHAGAPSCCPWSEVWTQKYFKPDPWKGQA